MLRLHFKADKIRRIFYVDDKCGTWVYNGGILTDQASHHIGLLELMTGDFELVFAKSTSNLVDIETEDTAVAIMKFTVSRYCRFYRRNQLCYYKIE